MKNTAFNKVDLNSYDAEFAREELIYNCTEDLLVAMQDRGVTKSDLASMLGTSKANISQILNGTRNMTLKSLSDIAFVLGLNVKLTIDAADIDLKTHLSPDSHWFKDEFKPERKVVKLAEYRQLVVMKEQKCARKYA